MFKFFIKNQVSHNFLISYYGKQLVLLLFFFLNTHKWSIIYNILISHRESNGCFFYVIWIHIDFRGDERRQSSLSKTYSHNIIIPRTAKWLDTPTNRLIPDESRATRSRDRKRDFRCRIV